MIDDLDRTLEELLKRELPPGLVAQVTITFTAPDSQFPPSSVTLPAIDLFLYDLREDRELRSNEWLVERQSNRTITQKRPPERVECSYLITAWPSASSTTPAYDEHRLLAEVMKVLLRHPTIPAAVLQGSLKEQELALPTGTLQPGHLQSMSEFWLALGGKPRAAFNYTVTIGVEVGKPVEAGPPVIDTMMRFKQGGKEE